MNRRYHTHIRQNPLTHPRACDHKGCESEGHYPAPRQKQALQDYYWFCLVHVREYNKQWNYFAGMDEEEVEISRQQDVIWERPSWPVTDKRSLLWMHTSLFQDPKKDAYGSFASSSTAPPSADSHWFAAGSAEEKALKVLELQQPLTLVALKKAYKKLVKKFHPDHNKGCKAAEDKLKLIIISYALLKKALQQ